MANADTWTMIHAERGALATDLDPLADEQWDTRSLCPEWTVREVVGHLTAASVNTPGKFFSKLAGSGFSFNKMVAKDVAEQMQGTPADTLARFKAQEKATTHPPGPTPTWLGEIVVHSEDIRRPLGIKRDYPTEALLTVANFYKGSNLIIGAKKRITGLTFTATDAEWTTGSGPEVSGPLISLIVAMTGRPAGIDDLSGDGVATLKGRP